MSKSRLDSNKKWKKNNPERYLISRDKSGKNYRKKHRSEISRKVREVRNFDVCDVIREHSKDMEEDTEAFSDDFMLNFIFSSKE